jgi:hypothetical protein
MKYYKQTLGGTFICYQPDPAEYGGEINIPHAPGNQQYDDMMAGVDADPPTNTIEDKPLDYVKTYADNRRDAYASTGDQLDMQYHDAVDGTTTWKDHVAAVKAANPKP